MSVPDRVEAVRLLLRLDPPPWHLQHSRAVAETAAWLAARIDANAIPVNRPLVEAAALLHDVDKLLSSDDPANELRHGDAGADWLTRLGHGELARAVANHPVTRLADDDRYRRWSAFATREERIVAYADKRCRQRLITMNQRFSEWERRHPGFGPEVRRRAERLEVDVCRAAAVAPAEVRRLAWTRAALLRAEA